MALSSSNIEVLTTVSANPGSGASSVSSGTSTSGPGASSAGANPISSPISSPGGGASASLTLQEVLHLLGVYSRAAPMHGLGR